MPTQHALHHLHVKQGSPASLAVAPDNSHCSQQTQSAAACKRGESTRCSLQRQTWAWAPRQAGCSRSCPRHCRQQKVRASLAAGGLSVLGRLRQGTHPNCSSRRASAPGTSGRSDLAGFAPFLPTLCAMRSAGMGERISLLRSAGAWCGQASPSTDLSRYFWIAGSYRTTGIFLGTESADQNVTSGDLAHLAHLGLQQRHQAPHLLLLLLLLLVLHVLACTEQKLLGQRRSPAE